MDEENEPSVFNQFGYIKQEQGDYIVPIKFYDKAFQLLRKIPPLYHPKFIRSLTNFGVISMEVGEYANALFAFRMALNFQQKIPPSIHLDFIYSYACIGRAYEAFNGYPKALSF